MPNGILSSHTNHATNKQQRHDDSNIYAATHHQSGNNNINTNNTVKMLSSSEHKQQSTPPSTNILNVAEMLLHGVADHEILDIWLRSIACQEFVGNFVNAGYDMPTISRITPQDLTAIGITDPTKRSKILTEIKKLNLQDGLPNFKPNNLNHWLSLLRLDGQYFKLLCDQQIDTIEKMCQLTWEDFEELGITKLGHQKRFLLAIERMKDIETSDAKLLSQPLSEPIYDTNPSQILLVASAENHSMNGPIMNKQSSTSELSSTGSGSMHSVYSANSIHHQPTYAPLTSMHNQIEHNQNNHSNRSPQLQNQNAHPIYSQPPSQLVQKPPNTFDQNQVNQHQQQPIQAHITSQQTNQQLQQNSHYQAIQPIATQPQFINPIYGDTSNFNVRNTMLPQTNRQSLGQLPYSALANLHKQQQHILQQSSIYATLSRQPQRVKQPPPPVPVRTNSLKTNSLVDGEDSRQQLQKLQQLSSNGHSSSQTLTSSQANSVSSLFRSATRRSQFNSQTLLSKNKSFSGNAHMDAARARFLNRNNQIQAMNHLPQQPQSLTMQPNPMSSLNHGIYGINTIARNNGNLTNGLMSHDNDNSSLYSQHSLGATNHLNNFNMNHTNAFNQLNQIYAAPPVVPTHLAYNPNAIAPGSGLGRGDDQDTQSDANSTKSLLVSSSGKFETSPTASNHQISSSQDSGSSQTLYNSASSGSNEQILDGCNNISPSGVLMSKHSTTSNSTLNDVNQILNQQTVRNQQLATSNTNLINNYAQKLSTTAPVMTSGRNEHNATTGKDDDFPPPPSPLSLTDSDDHDVNPLGTDNSNFTDISHGMMTFRVGI